MPSKWSDATERDLLVIMIQTNNTNSTGPRYQWDAIVDSMKELGYDFTKEAITQHFSKKIMKQHKDRHPQVKGAKSGGGSAASSKTSTPAKSEPKSTPSSKRKVKKEEYNPDDQDEDNKVDLTSDTPTKKKVKVQTADSARGRRERSHTMAQAEADASFEKWHHRDD